MSMLVALVLPSCTSPREGPAAPRVYWMGTPEYKAQVANLKLSRRESEKWLRTFYSAKPHPEDHSKAGEAAIVDDWYQIGRGATNADICLSGWYVNGMTGAIQSRLATHDPLKYRGQPTNFRWVHVEDRQGPISRGKVGQLPYTLKRRSERSLLLIPLLPLMRLMPDGPEVKSKLPPGGELSELSDPRLWRDN